MAAHADDLRHWYAEHIGPSYIVPVGLAATASPQLPPGRYLIHTINLGGATQLWIRQGAFGFVQDATAGAPSTPLDLTETPRPQLTFMSKGSGSGAGTERKATDGLSLIAVGGTVDVVLTRISREG